MGRIVTGNGLPYAFAIRPTHIGEPYGDAMARTYVRNVRTNERLTHPIEVALVPKRARVFEPRFAVLVLGVLAALLLAGCSAIGSGVITGKDYQPAHVTFTVICAGGKVIVCHPLPIWVSDKWRFDLRKGNDTGWVHVDHGTYDAHQVGDYYGGASS